MNPNIAADWTEEIFAWADKFNIPEKFVPRNKKELLVITHMDLSNTNEEMASFGYEIDYLPEAISRLHNLTVLDLLSNRLTELPESIGKLCNLTELSLSKNQLTK